jgi:two-component system, NarL family, sensor kinase
MKRAQAVATVLGVVVTFEALASVTLSLYADWDFATYVGSFTFSNGLIGLSFGLSGAVIAYHRPRNPVGWLLAAGGLLQAMSAVAAPTFALLYGWDDFPTHVSASGFIAHAWTVNIGLCLPLFLLLFPDGRPLSRLWRWVVVFTIVTAPLFSAAVFDFPGSESLAALWTATEVRGLVLLLLGLLSIAIRYHRGSEQQRQQLLWLIGALVIAIPMMGVWGFIAGVPILVLLVIPLLPVAVAIAIVRHNLLDIRLAISRLAAWSLLSLLALGAYSLVVGLVDNLVAERAGRSAALTVLIALAAGGLLPRLQRVVDRLFYGDRDDPTRVVARVGEQLSAGSDGLESVVDEVRRSLRLAYVAVRIGEQVTASGREPGATPVSLPLHRAGEEVGELVVAPRSGEKRLSDRDLEVLVLVAAPLAVAASATALSQDLQASRERLVTAREAERRRLRRDLHDGIGPALTGIAMKADAATNKLRSDADARYLVEAVSADVRRTIGEVRRVIDDLRPESLDELGLIGALRERAQHVTVASPMALSLELPDQLPEVSAAVEVAAYRVATEALNNAVRHSGGRTARLRITVTDLLEVAVADDGPSNEAWEPGLGLAAMRERVNELGGDLYAGHNGSGGRVIATFPLESR